MVNHINALVFVTFIADKLSGVIFMKHFLLNKFSKSIATLFLAATITSCVDSNSKLSVSEQVLKIQEDNKKKLVEHQSKLKSNQISSTRTAALVAPITPKVKKTQKRKVQKASVGAVVRPSGNITQNASLNCSPKRLKNVIYQVARKFGHVVVNSTGRSKRKNRLIGGASRSYHLNCQAIDFRVTGNSRGLYRYLRNHPSVGGLKRYRSGFYHIDSGPRRTW